MKSIGIDVGKYSIKIFEVLNSSKGLQLINYYEHPLNHDQNADNQLVILDALRNLVSVNDPALTKYIVSIPQSQVSTRYKFFPFKERSKVLKTIPFELEDDIPFDQEDAVFEAKFVRYRGSTSEVLASACLKSYINEIVQFFQDAGIDPDIVSAEGLAMANLVEDFNAPPPQEELPKAALDDEDTSEEVEPEQGFVLLNLGHSKTILSAFRGFNLVYTRTIEWGGRDIARAVAAKYSISYQEAIKEVESKGFILTSPDGASRDQIAFSNTIASAIRELTRELNLSLIDIKSEFNLTFSHIAMTGGSSQIKNLGAYLSHALGTPANTLDYLNRFTEVYVDKSPQLLAQSGVALALAIEGTKRPINPASNFRQEDLAKKSQVFHHFVEKWGYSLKLAGVLFVLFFVYAVIRDSISYDLDEATYSSLKKKARDTGIQGGTPSRVRKFIRDKKNDLKHRAALVKLNKMNSALDILEMVSKTVPRKGDFSMDVRRFFVNVDSVTVEGSVGKAIDLAKLEKSLKAMAVSGKVNKLPTNQTGTGVPFAFEFKVDRRVPLASNSKPKSKSGK